MAASAPARAAIERNARGGGELEPHRHRAIGHAPGRGDKAARARFDEIERQAIRLTRRAGGTRRNDETIDACPGDDAGLDAGQLRLSAPSLRARFHPQAAVATSRLGVSQRDAPRAGEQVGQPGAAQDIGCNVCEEARGDKHVVDQRLDHQPAPERFEYRRNPGRVERQATVLFGKRRSDQAQIAQQGPVGARKSLIGCRIGTATVNIVLIFDEALGERLQHFFVFGEVEVHDRFPLSNRKPALPLRYDPPRSAKS